MHHAACRWNRGVRAGQASGLPVGTLPLALAACTLLMPVQSVRAQQPAGPAGGKLFHSDVAGNRDETDGAEQPIMLGIFRIAPELTTIGGYDSNIFNLADATDDVFAAIAPQLDVAANWEGGSTSLLASGRILRYANRTSENSEALNLAANGQLDLDRNSTISTGLTASRTPEPRGTGGVGVGAAEPVVRRELRASLGSRGQIGSLVYGGTVTAQAQRYNPLALRGGGQADQRFRNLDSVGAQLQAGVALSGSLVAFGQADMAREKSLEGDRSIARDNHSQTFSLGLRGDITPLVAAQIVIGYRTLDYKLSRYRDFSAPSYNAIIDWYPRPLVSLRGEFKRFLANSGILDSAGIDTQSEQVTVFYDPLRMVRIELRGVYFDEQYRNTSLSTKNYEIGLSGRYEFVRRLAMTVDAGYRRRRSTDATIVSSFNGLSTSLGIRFGL